MKKKIVAGLATGVLLLGMAGMAQALVVQAPPTDSYMKLNGNNANAAVLVSSNNSSPINDSVSILNALGGSFSGNAFSLIAKTDEGGTGSLGGITFSISATTGTSGTWDLTWSGLAQPVNIDLVGVLKGGNQFAAFLFADALLASPGGTNNLNDPENQDDIWQITFLNNGGNIPELSHLSLYGRDVTPVPEPTTMLLLGTGLIGLAAGVRRKR